MSYKFSTGSIRKGDIYFEDDRTGEPTYIDFGQDTITLRPSGSQILHATPSSVSIGSTTTSTLLNLDGTDPTITFIEDNSIKATIGVNSSDNILIENKTINKHIVFKANDQGTVREGLRLDGAVPEVVVNQQHGVGGDDSLIDFRVESDNNTHMLFVDGSEDKVGIGTQQPAHTLHVAGDIGVDQYIYHAGDNNTHINFTADKIVLKAGNKSMITMEEKDSPPHEVTINDGGNNIDFVVEDNSGATLLKTDASTGRVGVDIAAPSSTLHINGSVAHKVNIFNAANDPGATYTIADNDYMLLINTRPTAEGGIDSAITITLPGAASAPGRMVIVKDGAGYADINSITVQRQGSDTIDGIDTSVTISSPSGFKRYISDGISSWYAI